MDNDTVRRGGLASAAAAAVSPSLAGAGGSWIRSGDAYEIKYALDERTAQEVDGYFSAFLLPDPHGDPLRGGAYEISSLYTDTARRDVFLREGRYANCKYRVRRYGVSETVYCERKSVRSCRVRKRRVSLRVDELERRLELRSGETEWFARQVSARSLVPVCRVRYLRRAMFGMVGGEGMRVTFDRSLRGALATGWRFDAAGDERELLPGVVVCEFKFAGAMPAPMKAIASRLMLVATGVSKYRACVRAFGQEHVPVAASGRSEGAAHA